jgi:hypothetical protein
MPEILKTEKTPGTADPTATHLKKRNAESLVVVSIYPIRIHHTRGGDGGYERGQGAVYLRLMCTLDHGRATQITSRQALTSRHSHAWQNYMLVPLASIAWWEGGIVARKGDAASPMSLEQLERAADLSPTRKRGLQSLSGLSGGPQREDSCAPFSSPPTKRASPPQPPWSRPPLQSGKR